MFLKYWTPYLLFNSGAVCGASSRLCCPEEDKLLEPVNLVRRKLWPVWGFHRKYFENFTHKSMSMASYSYSAKGLAWNHRSFCEVHYKLALIMLVLENNFLSIIQWHNSFCCLLLKLWIWQKVFCLAKKDIKFSAREKWYFHLKL